MFRIAQLPRTRTTTTNMPSSESKAGVQANCLMIRIEKHAISIVNPGRPEATDTECQSNHAATIQMATLGKLKSPTAKISV